MKELFGLKAFLVKKGKNPCCTVTAQLIMDHNHGDVVMRQTFESFESYS